MGEKVTIQQVAELITDKMKISSADAEAFAKVFFDLIIEVLEKDRYVKIKGLGTFKLVSVDSRESINVNTGERFEIQSYTKVSFTPENSLKDRINKPFAHFETVVLNDNVFFDNEDKEQVAGPTKTKNTAATEQVATPTPEKKIVFSAEKPVVQEPVKPKESKPVKSPAPKPVKKASTSSTASSKSKRKKASKKQKRRMRMQQCIIIALLVVLALLGCLFLNPRFRTIFFSEPSPVSISEQPSQLEKILTDSIVERKDTTTTDTVIPKQEVPQVAPVKKPQAEPKKEVRTPRPPGPIPVNPDSTSYEIIGTKTNYMLKEGETLIRVSMRFYGTKDLWPYLVKHNQDIIVNPNKVPNGATLRIPELRKKQQ